MRADFSGFVARKLAVAIGHDEFGFHGMHVHDECLNLLPARRYRADAPTIPSPPSAPGTSASARCSTATPAARRFPRNSTVRTPAATEPRVARDPIAQRRGAPIALCRD